MFDNINLTKERMLVDKEKINLITSGIIYLVLLINIGIIFQKGIHLIQTYSQMSRTQDMAVLAVYLGITVAFFFVYVYFSRSFPNLLTTLLFGFIYIFFLGYIDNALFTLIRIEDGLNYSDISPLTEIFIYFVLLTYLFIFIYLFTFEDVEKEWFIKSSLFVSALFAIIALIFIISFLLIEALPLFTKVWNETFGPTRYGLFDFLFGTKWLTETVNPDIRYRYGIVPLVTGTFLSTFGALLLAVPIGIGSAIYISELASPRTKQIVKPVIELLAGIPSVVYGFFGMRFLIASLQDPFLYPILPEFLSIPGMGLPSGSSWFAGSIMLAIMGLPTITSVAEDAIAAVPKEFKEASLGLGANQWQTIRSVILPTALSGITAAVILGMGRAIGETMAIILVTGNKPIIPSPIYNIFSGILTVTGTIGIELPHAAGSHHHAIIALALVLMIITLIVNLTSVFIMGRLNARLRGTKTSEKEDIVKLFGIHVGEETVGRMKQTFKYMVYVILTYGLFFFFGIISGLIVITATFIAYYMTKNKKITYVTAILSTIEVLFLCNSDFLLLLGFPMALISGYLVKKYVLDSLTFAQQQQVAFGFAYVCVGTALTILFVVLSTIIINGLPALSIDFITSEPEDGGIAPAIVGTFYLVAGAIIFALPIGVLAAIFLNEYQKEGRLTKIVRTGFDLLNGTPSIVFGAFGFTFFLLYLEWGISLIAGQITLGLMILPTVLRTTEESLKSVPHSVRHGSLALGATKWQTTRKVTLPAAIPGIITGAILSIGRAAGETAPIMFVAVIIHGRSYPKSLFQPVYALTYEIYYLSTEGGFIENARQIAYGTSTVLLIIVISLYLIAILVRNYFRKKIKW